LPHAHHFLGRLDRVTRAHTEFALNLYNDGEAVKFVLERAHLPREAERIALAIGDAKQGPFVIVTRDGRFVTCLGEGMSVGGCPIVARSQIDGLLSRLVEKRARREVAAREMRPNEDEDDLFQRIFTRGKRLTREEFLAVSAFESMLGVEPFLLMIDVAADLVKNRPLLQRIRQATSPGTLRAVEGHDRLEWAVAHLMLLSGAAERADLDALLRSSKNVGSTPSYLCSVQLGQTFFLRGAWAAARLGKGLLPTYRAVLENATDWVSMLDAALGIAAIGLRHGASFDDARRILQAQHAIAEKHPGEMEYVGRAAFGHWAIETMDDVQRRIEQTYEAGRGMCVTYGEHLPEGHALRFTRPEDVPDLLARAAVLSFDGDVHDEQVQTILYHALGMAARASAEDFYFPRDVVRAWFGAWSPEETLFRLQRFEKAGRKREPARVEARPGRNDPCPCGSGKKYKKCHGAARTVPE